MRFFHSKIDTELFSRIYPMKYWCLMTIGECHILSKSVAKEKKSSSF